MKPTLFDLLDNQQMPDHARPDVSLGEVRETVDQAVAEYRKALAARVGGLPLFVPDLGPNQRHAAESMRQRAVALIEQDTATLAEEAG